MTDHTASDTISCLNAKNACCFSRGKRAAIVGLRGLPSFFSSLCVVFSCFVSIPPAVRPILFYYDRRLSDLLRVHKFGCVPYTRKGARHKQVCTRVDSEGLEHFFLNCPFTFSRQGIEPMVFGFEFRCSNHCATVPRIEVLAIT